MKPETPATATQQPASARETACDICGQPLPAPAATGRPRSRHDLCRELSAALNRAEQLAQTLIPTPACGAQLRSRCWAIGNALNRGCLRYRGRSQRGIGSRAGGSRAKTLPADGAPSMGER